MADPGLVGGRSAAIVGDVELQLAVAVMHLDGHMRGPAVLDGVGERLLDDAVGGQAEPRRQPVRLALDAQVDLQAAALGVLGQLAELRQTRLGREGQRPAVLAQDTQQPPHLGDGLTAALLDRQQRLAHAAGLALEHLARGAGLEHHQADVVGDDVVELSGDA